jgi:type IV secretion system protein VirB5
MEVTMKRPLHALFLLCCLGFLLWAPSAHAQWAVFDGANLTNNQIDEIRNYAQYLQQASTAIHEYQQLMATYQLDMAEYNSLNGVRSYQTLFDNPVLREFMPPDYANTLAQAAACPGLQGQMLASCIANGLHDASQSLLTTAEMAVNARRNQVQSLMNQLAQAKDAKDSADLNVRMTGEVANLLNEMEATKLEEEQRALDQQQQQQIVLNNVYSTASETPDPLGSMGAVSVKPITP